MAVKTIDLTPTWGALLPALVEVAANGETAEGRKVAMEELQRMASISDTHVAANKPQSELLDLVDHLHKAAEIAASLENTYEGYEGYTGDDDDEDTALWTSAQEMIEKLQEIVPLSDIAGEIECVGQTIQEEIR